MSNSSGRVRHADVTSDSRDAQATGQGLPHSVAWALSITVGKIVFTLAVILLVVQLVSGGRLKRIVLAVTPEAVVKLFTAETVDTSKVKEARDAFLGSAASAAKALSKSSPQSRLMVGATKEQVLAIEGQPTQASETVWEYGNSRIFFAGNLVVSWVSSPDRPLHTK